MTTRAVYVVDALRTPIAKYAGGLATVRPDDLAAHVIAALVARNAGLASRLDQVVFGATNQAGEDNRNVARMALLLAGLPYEVPAVTVNRLCGSGLEAIGDAARMIATGEAECAIAGGVESMTRAPFSMPKQATPFDRSPPALYDTTLGWRYPNPRMEAMFPLETMGETAENVYEWQSECYQISREAQDQFAYESQRRARVAMESGRFAEEIVPVPIPQRRGDPVMVERDEHPRPDTTLEALAKLRPAFRENGTVTAGNASGLNDGAAAVLIMSGVEAARQGLRPKARIMSRAVAGVDPRAMGLGPIPATRKALKRAGLHAEDLDLVELNEAFAVQGLVCIQELGLDPEKVNVNGGSIALGHPLGCSGARIVTTLVHELCRREEARYGLATMCVGVGQGAAVIVAAVTNTEWEALQLEAAEEAERWA